MNLLLDTHAFLWMSLDDPQLSETARGELSDTENELYLSPASYWEIAIKISIGKYNLTEPLAAFVKREIIANNFKVLPIDIDHTAEISALPFHHKDPFDRMLIAQSMVENFPLVSRDTILDQYGVVRIW
ncbi:MAG: type II toxin-antitoxin system VapC family toxin [Gemmatimonadetes bacterium]|nr:type II toxin-antitoxin system VapC family toxin [Gemmatimonadota bacterium]MDE2736485.1 type II toxin-antitoxin system VapC family toxin [Gemmatimonadota bacterium]